MNIWYCILKWIFKVYRMLFISSIRVSGLENLVEGPRILVVNHPNATDCCVLPYIFSEKLIFLIQANIFNIPVVGTILRRSEQIPVLKGKGYLALDAAMTHLSKGRTVVIFPEGRLNHGKKLHRAGLGAALLARRSGAPIIPIGIFVPPQNTKRIKGKVRGRGIYGHWQVGGCCYINIGESWKVTDVNKNSVPKPKLREITERIMEEIHYLVQESRVLEKSPIR